MLVKGQRSGGAADVTGLEEEWLCHIPFWESSGPLFHYEEKNMQSPPYHTMDILCVGLQRTLPLNYRVDIFCIRSVFRMIHNMYSSFMWKRVDSTGAALKRFYNCGSQRCLVSSWSRREPNANLDPFSPKKEPHFIITCPMAGTVSWFLCNLSKWINLGEQSVNVK